MLAQVEGVDFTEIHRQAQGSPIIQLAYQARAGEAFWQRLDHDPLSVGKPVRAIDEVSARRFLTCPLLVGFNDTRIFATHAIRDALGYPKAVLYPGEPLVCRSKTPEDRVLGFFNNGLYTIMAVSQHDPRLITVKDGLGDVQQIHAHLEEVDGGFINPRAIPFRFGYAFTVHTAQGGEWPRVYISLPDLHQKVRKARRYGTQEALAQWAYTAITRAKEHVRFLTQHTFTAPHERTSMATPSRTPKTLADPFLLETPTPLNDDSPLMATASAAEDAIFGADDITDPAVPLSLQDALQTAEDAPGATNAPALNVHTPASPGTPVAPPDRFGEHEAIFQAALAHLMQKFDAAVNASVKGLNKETDELHSFMYQQLQVQRGRRSRPKRSWIRSPARPSSTASSSGTIRICSSSARR